MPVHAIDYKYTISSGMSQAALSGGNFFSFEKEKSLTFGLAHNLTNRWQFGINYQSYTFSNNIGTALTDSVGQLYNNSPLDINATLLGIKLQRLLLGPDRRLNFSLGFGGGILIWRGLNPETNTTYVVRGPNNEFTDFAATELMLSAMVGLHLKPSSRFTFSLESTANYLTSAGAEFEIDLSDKRAKIMIGFSALVHFNFGARARFPSRMSDVKDDKPRVFRTDPGNDSDNDGVPDSRDNCINTPYGVVVDIAGCPRDSDRDGVPNGLDDCPRTPAAATTTVDIKGCAVDSDFDGLADYLDACPNNRVGALVDARGCPTDEDNDGVPDGLDDCPGTLPEVAVDPNGCLDLTMFSKPMVLNIDYVSGSFEIDPNSKGRLKRLAGLLNFVTDINIEINAYTDNIGTTVANRRLSEKRANRVRDYLVTQSVATERIKVFGRGETNFTASNQTAAGRAKNRRVEIIFYR